jgi:hypothetical protein
VLPTAQAMSEVGKRVKSAVVQEEEAEAEAEERVADISEGAGGAVRLSGRQRDGARAVGVLVC